MQTKSMMTGASRLKRDGTFYLTLLLMEDEVGFVYHFHYSEFLTLTCERV